MGQWKSRISNDMGIQLVSVLYPCDPKDTHTSNISYYLINNFMFLCCDHLQLPLFPRWEVAAKFGLEKEEFRRNPWKPCRCCHFSVVMWCWMCSWQDQTCIMYISYIIYIKHVNININDLHCLRLDWQLTNLLLQNLATSITAFHPEGFYCLGQLLVFALWSPVMTNPAQVLLEGMNRRVKLKHIVAFDLKFAVNYQVREEYI